MRSRDEPLQNRVGGQDHGAQQRAAVGEDREGRDQGDRAQQDVAVQLEQRSQRRGIDHA